MPLNAELLQVQDIPLAVAFANQSRQLLFPEAYTSSLPHDVSEFKHTYFNSTQGACFVIKDHQHIVGMIAYRAYDSRFNFDLPAGCVETVKLFILPDYRRQGLASHLSQTLLEHAKQKGIQHLYLHTHPFLPAAEHFWRKVGFHVIHREQVKGYDTIHMLKSII